MLRQAAAWTGMNGLGLALVMPCAQSIMAEVFSAKERGRAFGTLFTLSAVGKRLLLDFYLAPSPLQLPSNIAPRAWVLLLGFLGEPAVAQRWIM